MQTIYDFILSKGTLSEKHKADLQKNRGFTEETITRFKFFSGGQYLLKSEDELIAAFPAEDLLKAGACIRTGKLLAMAPALLDNRVIIPYLDDGKAVLLRPHKLGLHDVPIQVYVAQWDKSIILTEGEFKAVAAAQMGLGAIAVPGISSFIDQHFDDLVKMLNAHAVRDVCIIFDNEVKDDPQFPNYKANPSHRYDTQHYSYLMAYQLEKQGKKVRIGVLPDSWRVKGKIDIDGALAQGKTKDDLLAVIAGSYERKEYLEELPKEAQKILSKKRDRKYFRSHLQVEHGCYVAMRWDPRKKEDYPETISNFTIRITAYNHTISEGLVRDLVFLAKDGTRSRSYSIKADDMNNDAWKTFCYKVGNFIWKGKPEDLSVLWESEFLNSEETRFIYEPDHVGWYSDDKLWLFGNVAIRADGTEMRPDENGVFWAEHKGIRPVSLIVTTGKNQTDSGIPYLNLKPFDMHLFKNNLSDTIGGMQANLCCGWVNACFFLEDVFKLHGCFPFLFLRGLKGSGKTKIATWLSSCFGIEGEGFQIEGTTAVGAGRYMGYYSSLPVLFDDYRNSEKVQNKDGFFRNVYNRQSAGKGMKQDYGIREQKIRGTVLFTGEETPHDGALMERCISIFISEKVRAKNHIRWFSENRAMFSGHGYYMLKHKPTMLPVFLRVLNEAFDYFSTKQMTARVSVNYAIICAGYASFFGEKDLDFASWVLAETARAALENRQESMTAQFFDDILALKVKGKLGNHYWDTGDGKIYLYIHGLYNEWAEDYRKRRGEPPFKESAIRDYLKDEPGFLAHRVNWRIGGSVVSSTVFSEELATEQLKNIVSAKDVVSAPLAHNANAVDA